MTDRYQPMTMAESAELARQNETQAALDRVEQKNRERGRY